MKIKSLIFPIMVFVCAIGMAFTTIDLKENPKEQASDYLLINGSWQAIDEQDCPGTGFTCQVRIGENGPVYPVYDEMNDDEPKTGNSNIPTVIHL